MYSNALEGSILSVPLVLKDHKTQELIKESSIYIHANIADSYRNVWLTGMCQEGCFHTVLKVEQLQEALGKDYDAIKWHKVLELIFAGEAEEQFSLKWDATYETLKDYYDKEFELRDDEELPVISETVILLLKTAESLSRTKYKIELEMVDSIEDSTLKREQNLFSWIETALQQNDALRRQLEATQASLDTFSAMSSNQQEELEASHKEHKRIIEDLQEKLYAVLNAKKARIWQLEGKHLLKLDHLNQIFEDKRAQDLNNRSIDVNSIPTTLDSIYVRQKKRKAPQKSPKKKVKQEVEEQPVEASAPASASLTEEDAGESSDSHSTDYGSDNE